MSDPLLKSRENPRSLRLAVNAKCYDCMGRAAGWRRDVEDCTAPMCPLYALRPRSRRLVQGSEDDADT